MRNQIKCIDYRDLSGPERQSKVIDRAKCSGHLDIAFVCNGTHLRLGVLSDFNQFINYCQPVKRFLQNIIQ